MGFSSGKSKAKREQKKAMQAAYWQRLREVKPMNPLGNIDTQGRRKIEDQLGNDMSYQSKRLAHQADSLGRKINTGLDGDGGINSAIGKYNDRYEELQHQMNGGSIKRYTTKIQNPQGIAQATAGNGGLFSSPAAASAAAAQQQASLDAGNRNPLTGQMRPQVNAITKQPTGPRVAVQETELGPITPSYRTLYQTRQAYDELSGLSKNIANNPASQFAQQYEAIGQKLQKSLQRDVRMASPPKQQTGLLASEVMSGTGQVDKEVIG